MAGPIQNIQSAFGNTPGSTTSIPRFGASGQNLLGNVRNAASNQLTNPPATPRAGFNFAPIEQQAVTNFNQQTVPSIAERFTSMGGQGGSGFAQALGSAGANLQQSLAALKAQYGFNQQGFDLQQQGLDQSKLGMLLGQGLQPENDNLFQPEQAGFAQAGAPFAGNAIMQLLQMLSTGNQGQQQQQSGNSGIGAGIGGAAGSALGPLGGAAGSALGSGLENLIRYLTTSKKNDPGLSNFRNNLKSFPLQS